MIATHFMIERNFKRSQEGIAFRRETSVRFAGLVLVSTFGLRRAFAFVACPRADRELLGFGFLAKMAITFPIVGPNPVPMVELLSSLGN